MLITEWYMLMMKDLYSASVFENNFTLQNFTSTRKRESTCLQNGFANIRGRELRGKKICEKGFEINFAQKKSSLLKVEF